MRPFVLVLKRKIKNGKMIGARIASHNSHPVLLAMFYLLWSTGQHGLVPQSQQRKSNWLCKNSDVTYSFFENTINS
jgi:hypothetical protein